MKSVNLYVLQTSEYAEGKNMWNMVCHEAFTYDETKIDYRNLQPGQSVCCLDCHTEENRVLIMDKINSNPGKILSEYVD
jgi:hypothetical protein